MSTLPFQYREQIQPELLQLISCYFDQDCELSDSQSIEEAINGFKSYRDKKTILEAAEAIDRFLSSNPTESKAGHFWSRHGGAVRIRNRQGQLALIPFLRHLSKMLKEEGNSSAIGYRIG